MYYISTLTLQILICFLFLGIGMLIYLNYLKFLEKEELKQRLQRLNDTVKILRETKKNTSLDDTWYRKIFFFRGKDLLKNSSAETAKRYRLRFEQAGWDGQDAVLIVSMVNIGLALFGIFFYVLLMISFKTLIESTLIFKITVFIVIMAVCVRSFDYFMDYVIKKRYEKVLSGLTYAIDLLGICSRSGFGLERSFEKIAQEMGQFNPELCKEFTKTAVELAIIPERNTALRNLAQRIDTPLIHMLVSSLIQAEEQGASLSSTLRSMSIEFSKQKMLEIEEKATKLPALLTLPLILFLIPAIMIVLLGPAFHDISNSDFFRS